MTSYLKNWLEKDLILENLDQYDDESLFEILNSISPENFSDLIYVSEFYLKKNKFRNLFLEKVKKIKNWKIYFDHDCPVEFLDVFFDVAQFDLTDQELVLYYLRSYKLPLDIFEKHFIKIYQYILNENLYNRKELRKKSIIYNGIFVVYTKEEIIRVFDYLMDKIERYPIQIEQLNNPFMDVLLIMINYVKGSKQEIQLPYNRLERLNEVSK